MVFLVFIVSCFRANAQKIYKVKVQVQDTTGTKIAGVPIMLIAGADTIKGISTDNGAFTFDKIHATPIFLVIKSFRFNDIRLKYDLNPQQEEVNIPAITLKEKSHQLEQVSIKVKQLPIILKQDTIEYDVASFSKNENDLLEDLLRKLPSIQIDNNGNVTQMGKVINTLKVNGLDFFNGNIKDFLKQLPVGIMSKLQVIDDYGVQANFTGVKTGEPTKLINLVIKPGMDHGRFGDGRLAGGTNDQYTVSATGNYWQDKKQISLNGTFNTVNNLSGNNNTNSINANFRNTYNKAFTIFGSYTYFNNKYDVETSNYTVQIFDPVSIYNYTDSHVNSMNDQHNLTVNMDYKPADNKNYFTMSSNFSTGLSNSGTTSASKTTGGITSNVSQNNVMDMNNKMTQSSVSMGHRFGKPGRTIVMNILYGLNTSAINNNITDTTQYFTNNVLAKDSLFHRLVSNNVINTDISVKLIYTEPLTKKSSIDIQYFYSRNLQRNNFITSELNGLKKQGIIDSLSDNYSNLNTANLWQLNYRYDNKKFRLLAGYSFQAATLTSESDNDRYTIIRKTYNSSPIVNIDYNWSKKNNFSLILSSHNIAPRYDQLKPVKDINNPLNIIVGNPELKPSFVSEGSFNYKHITDLGSFFNASLHFDMTRNKIATNVLLRPDAIGILQQETHFVNVNGAYSVGGNYSLYVPVFSIQNQKAKLSLSGNATFSNNPTLINDVKSLNKNVNLTQTAGIGISLNKLNLTVASTYNQYENELLAGVTNSSIFRTLQYGFAVAYLFTPSLTINADGNRFANRGFNNLIANNPFVLNASISQKLFKNKSGELQLQAFDIFNQNNNINRSFSENTITQSRTQYITQYLKLSFVMRLSKFGN